MEHRDADGRVSFEDFASYVQKNEAKIWQAFRCALAPPLCPCALGLLTHALACAQAAASW